MKLDVIERALRDALTFVACEADQRGSADAAYAPEQRASRVLPKLRRALDEIAKGKAK